MIVTTIFFLAVVMLTGLIGVAVIPRFDRRTPVPLPQAATATGPRTTASRNP